MTATEPNTDRTSFDPLATEFIACPFPTYDRLRDETPVVWVPHGLGFWLVTRYDLVVQVARDYEAFSSELPDLTTGRAASPELSAQLQAISAGDVPRVQTLLTLDPPPHSRHRRLVSQAFSPRSVQAFEPVVRQLARDLIATWTDGEPIDFVQRFAVPLPVGAISHDLGVPAERADDFKRWSDAAVALIGSQLSDEQRLEVARSVRQLHQFFLDQIAQRRAAPGDDLISLLVQARLADEDAAALGESAERGLSEPEMISILRQLLVAGNETTTNLLTQSMVLFGANPSWWSRMRSDPSIIPAVVEECLRLVTPSAVNQRVATRDVEIGGVTIRAGDRVLVSYLAANHDPRAFSEPTVFAAEREGASKHLAFGTGVHLCIGAALARLELRVAFDELSRRVETFEVLDDEHPWNASFILRAITALPIRPHLASGRSHTGDEPEESR